LVERGTVSRPRRLDATRSPTSWRVIRVALSTTVASVRLADVVQAHP
jgi:hypothetical protein